MDSLDFNLHQAVLSSLAGSLAREAKGKLSDGTRQENAGKASQQNGDQGSCQASVVDVSSTLGLSEEFLAGETEWCFQEVNAVVALAEYVAAAASPSQTQAKGVNGKAGPHPPTSSSDAEPIDAAAVDAVMALLARLPTVSIERCLGANGMSTVWLSADEVAFALGKAACGLATVDVRQDALALLLNVYAVLKQDIQEASASRVIEHILPSIHGVSRAIEASATQWNIAGLSSVMQSVAPLSHDAQSNLSSILRGSFVHSSSEGRYLFSILSKYEHSKTPISPNFVAIADSVILQAIAASLTSTKLYNSNTAWQSFIDNTRITFEAREADRDLFTPILSNVESRLQDNIAALQSADGDEELLEGYESDIITCGLKTATMLCCAASQVDTQLLKVLESLLSADMNSSVDDRKVLRTALECYSALLYRFPRMGDSLTALLRRFIVSSHPGLRSDGTAGPSSVLTAIGDTLGNCLEVLKEHDITLSVVYSLFNVLPIRSDLSATASLRSAPMQPSMATIPNGLSDTYQTNRSSSTRVIGDRLRVAAQTLFVVTQLAIRFKTKKDLTKLVLSMLLQRIRNAGDQDVEGVALLCLAELAPLATKEDFPDCARVMIEVGKTGNLSNNAQLAEVIATSQITLAKNLDKHLNKPYVYLRETLLLFVEQATPLRAPSSTNKFPPQTAERHPQLGSSDIARIYASLLHTLNIIAAVLSVDECQPLTKPDNEELVVCFRNMWLLSVALGLTSPSKPEAAKHRDVLATIAVKTPCLLKHTPLNYVDTELEYNSLLRREGGQSLETLRAELAAVVSGHNALQIRTVSYAQVVFLTAVTKLESMRAKQGNPSEILNYFHNQGVNDGSLGAPLMDVAQKVTEVFIRQFSIAIRDHETNESLPSYLKWMVRQCCSPAAKARKAALRSLNTIFAAFPLLLCDTGLITAVLECLTLLRSACEQEYFDEYAPVLEYSSQLSQITLTLPDNYALRNEILAELYSNAKIWLAAALAAAPLETTGLLQSYLDTQVSQAPRSASGMGKSVALEFAKLMPPSAKHATMPSYGGWKGDTTATFADAFGTRHTYGSEAATVIGISSSKGDHIDLLHIHSLKSKLREVSGTLRSRSRRYTSDDLRVLLYRTAAVIIATKELDYELLREVAFIPVHAINPPAMHLGVEVWAWLIDKRPDVERKLMVDLYLAWGWTVRRRRGIFSMLLKVENPLISKTEYSPTDIAATSKASRTVQAIITPQRYLLEFLTTRFQAYRYRDRYLVLGCLRMIMRSFQRYRIWGKHPLCRDLRLKLLTLGFTILGCTNLEAGLEQTFRSKLYQAALSWFEEPPTWSYGSDRLQMAEDARALQKIIQTVQIDQTLPRVHFSTRTSAFGPGGALAPNVRDQQLQQLLILHLENELQRLMVWSNPLLDPKKGSDHNSQVARSQSEDGWVKLVRTAWKHSPRLAVLMMARFKLPMVHAEIKRLIAKDTLQASTVPEALDIFLDGGLQAVPQTTLRNLVYWASVSPIKALRLFLPAFNREPHVLQFAMRTLEQHPVDLVFFYIPQVVQALRTDPLHYVERFVFETSKISQLFCHQMIWNMKANCFKDDLAEAPDKDKDTFETMVNLIVESLSGEAKLFFEKEFGFFNEVTSISRKLMPFVKKTKPEKKQKIDEEMLKIKVEKGVYLPSHPEGSVIDIDRHSGRPLQSHAKTPFMATFVVEREMAADYSETAITESGGEQPSDTGPADGNAPLPPLQGVDSVTQSNNKTETGRISAIFKVGDDCRQDVLAMQVIAQFKNIYNVFGLDLQVQPYKVLATGPGTGIIDVVPNATSRDEMGRAKINDLTSFFLFQFGPAESAAFQKARSNFIQSMAAYSVLCYILQIKDRHNGNIMIDGEGRITHIGPGGIKFEPNSFKLTNEMITLMGGKQSQGYRQFCELTVKAFLACRPYVEDVVSTCYLMMPTDLPSFKGEGTMTRLRERFRPELSEREAAKYMISVIENAAENSMSIIYDQFQYFQNKIPYAS